MICKLGFISLFFLILISFSCHTAPARKTGKILNKRGIAWNLGILPEFRSRSFNVFSLYIKFTADFLSH